MVMAYKKNAQVNSKGFIVSAEVFGCFFVKHHSEAG
jgi:hypothetical protein